MQFSVKQEKVTSIFHIVYIVMPVFHSNLYLHVNNLQPNW